MFEDLQIPSDIERVYIDVGLNHTAPHSLNWLESDSKGFVFGFEPVKENCERVLDEIKSRGFGDRFKLYQCAVDNVEGETIKDFYVTSYSNDGTIDQGQSSLFKFTQPENETLVRIKEVVPTKCVNLTDLLKVLDWDRFKEISCLKTATQGNDLNILKSIESYFDQIPLVYCEAHCFNQYENVPYNPNSVYDYMTTNGYRIFNCGVADADHYYMRDSTMVQETLNRTWKRLS